MVKQFFLIFLMAQGVAIEARVPILIHDYNHGQDHRYIQQLFKMNWDMLAGDLGKDYTFATVQSWIDEDPFIKVAKWGKKPVGFIFYFLKNPQEGHIDILCVDEKYRGRGIGKQLLQYAMQDLVDQGVQSITIYCWGFNIPAATLYQKLGFVKIEEWLEYSAQFQRDETVLALRWVRV